MKPEQGPQNLRFGGGVSDTVLNPAVLFVILAAGALICFWPRRRAIVPFLLASILIPMDQVLLIGSLHFPMLRLLVLFGFIRIMKDKVSSKARIFSGGVNKIDIAVILLTVFIALNSILLFQESGAVVNQLGNLFTVFGVYFLLRFLIRDEEDLVRVIQTFAWVVAIIAAIMTYEASTGHNPYALLGGARASTYGSLVIRDDKVRAQGPFAHSILAGTFGAILVPLFMALWWKGKNYRKIAVMGIISATVMTVACNSSTPILAYAAGVLALCMWPCGNRCGPPLGNVSCWSLALHIVMKGPVWSLIEKIDISGGSSSYHRYMLVDQCIRHFGDWWLLGVKDTSVWGWDMWDTANQYVGTCDKSGLLPFLLFIAILVYGFKFLGRARRNPQTDKQAALTMWAFGAALFANVVAFVGISYWDQTMVQWYALLAMISAITVIPLNNPIAAPAQAPSEVVGLLSQPERSACAVGAMVREESSDGGRPPAWHQIH